MAFQVCTVSHKPKMAFFNLEPLGFGDEALWRTCQNPMVIKLVRDTTCCNQVGASSAIWFRDGLQRPANGMLKILWAALSLLWARVKQGSKNINHSYTYVYIETTDPKPQRMIKGCLNVDRVLRTRKHDPSLGGFKAHVQGIRLRHRIFCRLFLVILPWELQSSGWRSGNTAQTRVPKGSNVVFFLQSQWPIIMGYFGSFMGYFME